MSATLSEARIAELLAPYTEPLQPLALQQIAAYLDLLLRWNARTNLTAIRGPEQLIQRQVGESLFAARLVPPEGTLLDFGSGAGFPGIPLAIALPSLRVTLAESQGKKASFLREAVRTLGLSAEVFASRVEMLPGVLCYNTVMMRAVDSTPAMLSHAAARVAPGGRLVRYLSSEETLESTDWSCDANLTLPLSSGRLAAWSRLSL